MVDIAVRGEGPFHYRLDKTSNDIIMWDEGADKIATGVKLGATGSGGKAIEVELRMSGTGVRGRGEHFSSGDRILFPKDTQAPDGIVYDVNGSRPVTDNNQNIVMSGVPSSTVTSLQYFKTNKPRLQVEGSEIGKHAVNAHTVTSLPEVSLSDIKVLREYNGSMKEISMEEALKRTGTGTYTDANFKIGQYEASIHRNIGTVSALSGIVSPDKYTFQVPALKLTLEATSLNGLDEKIYEARRNAEAVLEAQKAAAEHKKPDKTKAQGTAAAPVVPEFQADIMRHYKKKGKDFLKGDNFLMINNGSQAVRTFPLEATFPIKLDVRPRVAHVPLERGAQGEFKDPSGRTDESYLAVMSVNTVKVVPNGNVTVTGGHVETVDKDDGTGVIRIQAKREEIAEKLGAIARGEWTGDNDTKVKFDPAKTSVILVNEEGKPLYAHLSEAKAKATGGPNEYMYDDAGKAYAKTTDVLDPKMLPSDPYAAVSHVKDSYGTRMGLRETPEGSLVLYEYSVNRGQGANATNAQGQAIVLVNGKKPDGSPEFAEGTYVDPSKAPNGFKLPADATLLDPQVYSKSRTINNVTDLAPRNMSEDELNTFKTAKTFGSLESISGGKFKPRYEQLITFGKAEGQFNPVGNFKDSRRETRISALTGAAQGTTPQVAVTTGGPTTSPTTGTTNTGPTGSPASVSPTTGSTGSMPSTGAPQATTTAGAGVRLDGDQTKALRATVEDIAIPNTIPKLNLNALKKVLQEPGATPQMIDDALAADKKDLNLILKNTHTGAIAPNMRAASPEAREAAQKLLDRLDKEFKPQFEKATGVKLLSSVDAPENSQTMVAASEPVKADVRVGVSSPEELRKAGLDAAPTVTTEFNPLVAMQQAIDKALKGMEISSLIPGASDKQPAFMAENQAQGKKIQTPDSQRMGPASTGPSVA